VQKKPDIMLKLMAIFFLATAISIPAIIVEDYTVAESAPDGLNWNYTYNYKGSTAVSVGGEWVLTAAHVADDGGSGSLDIGGTVYTQQEIVYHGTADLALIRYDKAFQGSYALYSGPLTPPEGEPLHRVLMVGFGSMGSVSSNSWTDSGTGRGTRRWGSQEIDRTLIKRYDSEGSIGYTENHGFLLEFDLANTAHEAGTGSGDSGGGVFYKEGGTWKLAGISTSRGSVGGQYTSTFAISMPYYHDWITGVIPEPATTGMMGLSITGLYLSRGLRRRKKHVRFGRFLRRPVSSCDGFGASESRSSGQIRAACKGFMPAVQGSGIKNRIKSSLMVTRICAVGALDDLLKAVETAAEQMTAGLVTLRGRLGFRGRHSPGVIDRLLCDRNAAVLDALGRMVTGAGSIGVRLIDSFLEKISWDHKISCYNQSKKWIGALLRSLNPRNGNKRRAICKN
jgi:hypothetical protein